MAQVVQGGERSAPEGRRRRKPRPAPAANRGWTVRYALFAYAVSLVLDFAIAAALPRHALRIGLGALAIDLVMLATLIPLWRSDRLAARDLGLRGTSAPRAVGLVLAGIVVYLILSLIWLQAVLGHNAHAATPYFHLGIPGTIVAGIAACVSAPVVEELFFRGLIYRALRNRCGVAVSALTVGVLFGIVHGSTYPLDTLPIKALFGVLACLLYEWTGSLWPPIALHCLVDSTVYEESVQHGGVPYALLGFVAVAIGLLLWHRFRRPTEITPTGPRLRNHGRVADAIILRTGGRSARRLLAYLGLGIFLIGAVLAIAGPGHGQHHSSGGAAAGWVLILGIGCVVVALGWKLFGRRPPRGL